MGNKFYMVVGPTGTAWVRYATLNEAINGAQRLAIKEKQPFTVLQAVATVEVTTVTHTTTVTLS